MKPSRPRLFPASLMRAPLSPLRLSLLAALLLHMLGLSAWQLQRSRQRPPQRLSAADNTPLLLQFSRQAVQPSELLAVPLPPASTLPPPPPMPGRFGAPTESASAAGGQRPDPPTRPRPPVRQSGVKAQAGRAGGSAPRAAVAAPVAPPPLGSGAPARQALEKALREAAAGGHQDGSSPASGSSSEGEAGSPGGVEGARAGERRAGSEPGSSGAEAGSTAEQRLWSLGRPVGLPDRELQGLPQGLELRHLPLARARRSGARPIHLNLLRDGERLILIWIDGPNLWLLRAPLPAAPSGRAAAEPGASRS